MNSQRISQEQLFDQRTNAILSAMDAVYFECNFDGYWTFLSPQWMEFTGDTAVDRLGTSCLESFDSSDHSAVEEMLSRIASGETTNATHQARFKTCDNQEKWVTLDVYPMRDETNDVVGIYGLIGNNTERHAIDEDYARVKKLGDLGTLTAGIAHEVNTPIQFIGDNLLFLRDAYNTLFAEGIGASNNAGDDAEVAFLITEVPDAIDQALEGINRVSTLVRAMKSFSHPPQAEMQFADIEEAIRTSAIVGRNEYKYIADIAFDFAGVSPLRCHVSDLQQVFLNLIVNAAHAIEDANMDTTLRGSINIRTSEESDRVLIEFSDTGCGMTEEIKARIFERFFTTKGVGRGTGQGLALAYSVVVEKHKGTLDVKSTPGEGTTFILGLPKNSSEGQS